MNWPHISSTIIADYQSHRDRRVEHAQAVEMTAARFTMPLAAVEAILDEHALASLAQAPTISTEAPVPEEGKPDIRSLVSDALDLVDDIPGMTPTDRRAVRDDLLGLALEAAVDQAIKHDLPARILGRIGDPFVRDPAKLERRAAAAAAMGDPKRAATLYDRAQKLKSG